MQECLYVVVFASLANSQFLDTWINGTIFESLRAFPERWQKGRLPLRLVGELVLCPRCLSHWTAVPFLALTCWGWDVRPHPYAWPVVWLAVVALSRLFFRLAGGDEPKGDPFAGIEPYKPPDLPDE